MKTPKISNKQTSKHQNIKKQQPTSTNKTSTQKQQHHTKKRKEHQGKSNYNKTALINQKKHI